MPYHEQYLLHSLAERWGLIASFFLLMGLTPENSSGRSSKIGQSIRKIGEKNMTRGKIFLCVGFFVCLWMTTEGSSQETKGASLPGQAEMKVAADSDSYIIGPEDSLDIFVWKETELSRKVSVRQDGKISLPLLGEIQAAGLTPLKLKEQILQKLKEFIEVPTITVTVVEANSFKVYISGQVVKPGVYTLRSETSILQFISLVGGLTEWANPKKILLVRKEQGKEKSYTINYKKIKSGEDLSQNMALKPGDTIIVPD
jgi:polysaccharide biosynthesis/export protein